MAEMANALREAKKVLSMPRGSTLPTAAPPMPARNGETITEDDYEVLSRSMQEQGRLDQALRAIEKAIALRRRALGTSEDETLLQYLERSADLCNTIAMSSLQNDEFVECLKLLKKAEGLCLNARNKPLLAITLNNIACYYRRRGQPKVALSHLHRALEIEARCKAPHKPADTHLNVCAVSSQLGQHHQAMRHAKAALHLLKVELSGSLDSDTPSASGMLTGGGEPVGSPERMAVLAIAYHNLAVQQERLELRTEALRSYAHAADIASRHVGEGHAITTELRGAYDAASAEHSRTMRPMSAKRSKPAAVPPYGMAPPTPRSGPGSRQSAHERTLDSVRKHVSNLSSVRSGEYTKPPAIPHVPRNPDTFIPRDAALQDVGEGEDVAVILRSWLVQNSQRVMTLFRRWDTDQNGVIDRQEFHAAMKLLGLQVEYSLWNASCV